MIMKKKNYVNVLDSSESVFLFFPQLCEFRISIKLNVKKFPSTNSVNPNVKKILSRHVVASIATEKKVIT